MQFEVRKVGRFYRLWKINEKKYAGGHFVNKITAINQGLNWLRYRGEKGYVRGNKILVRK